MEMTTIKSDRYQQEDVLSAVYAADSVLLLCHVSPDGDTLGSALAMAARLERIGKKAQVMVEKDVPSYLAFLPGAERIKTPQSTLEPYDLVLAVDVSSVDRLGLNRSLFEASANTALVDHHGTNDAFARINMIDADAPATAIVVFRLFGAMDMPITREEAICLYTALSTDTGNFIYESTNAESFAMMSALMEAGLPLEDCSRVLFRQKEETFVRLLAQVLPSLHVLREGRIAGLTLTQAQMRQVGANNGHTDGLIDYAGMIEGVKLSYLARETDDGRVKVSLRSQKPYAVDTIAARYGGGGHKRAAGFTLNLPLAEAVRVVEAALEAALEDTL